MHPPSQPDETPALAGRPEPSNSAFDFRRPDRIAKSQLRAIHLLHENFVRSAMANLSAYLRTYLALSLVSVEQVSFAEFLAGLPSPTCLATLELFPLSGNAVLEVNSTLVYPLLEILLGGSGKMVTPVEREMTEIEKQLMTGLIRILLHNLREAWSGVSAIDFQLQSIESEPQFSRALAPTEAVVAVSIEVRLGEIGGFLNLAFPSLLIKMMSHKFEQQWPGTRSEPSAEAQERVFESIQKSLIRLEARLQGPTLRVRDLLELAPNDILTFDYPVTQPLICNLNGKPHFEAEIAASGRRKAISIRRRLDP